MTEIRAALCRQWPVVAALLVAGLSAEKNNFLSEKYRYFVRMLNTRCLSLQCKRLPVRNVSIFFRMLNGRCLSLQQKRLPVRNVSLFCPNVKHPVPIPPTEKTSCPKRIVIFFGMLNTRCLYLQQKRFPVRNVSLFCPNVKHPASRPTRIGNLSDCYSLTSRRKHPVPIPATKKTSCTTHIDMFCPIVKRPVPIPHEEDCLSDTY